MTTTPLRQSSTIRPAPAGVPPHDAPASSRASDADQRASPAIALEGVSFRYPFADDAQAPSADARAGGLSPDSAGYALRDVTLRVREGERLGILGPNGGGKSTLLKLVLGLLRPSAGSVRVLGLDPAEARRRRLIGYVAQRNEAELAFPLSARQVVEMGATLGTPPWAGASAAQHQAVREAMEVVGAWGYADRQVGKLSGGMLQRVLIARALAARPRVLLMDEPTVGIDPAGQQQFAELLAQLVGRMALTVVVVSHDLRTIAAGCDRVACLACTLHSHTDPRGLTPAVLAEVFRHDVAAMFGDLHVDAHPASSCNDPRHARAHGQS